MTRERVIDAAEKIVAELGLEGLSMRVLADRCAVSPMTLYRYV